ncbi:heterokaryon incompatibility protein-domain-containing protein [Stachybotrys elegans]|uniref:Heterokaryon incompatibility protein-domain-containing protein n=1 Tax=Stachybotrys elegans TaxID=80388 RepID=A0A8K0WN59_9HYPO|nr:heterokaryon incompatibility protein-domain-containing protein [Stachybotrys elegans]
MRLLHTTSLSITQFTERKSGAILVHNEWDAVPEYAVPRYAILSHTWEEEEVQFQDMQGDLSKIENLKGYRKIQGSCRRAKEDGFDWIWIDTCCIDKTSSAELSEAINSMFKWYRNSATCYVYLSDAPSTRHAVFVAANDEEEDEEQGLRYLARWYSRGWTLQELIAPSSVHFFDRRWRYIGTREDFIHDISRGTGIDIYALRGGDLSRMTVARRLTWLNKRQTTRVEDMAYCMLRIFDINMPLLYGEGTRAFMRLQEEIIKTTEDQSIFAWAGPNTLDYYREDYGDTFERSGLVADSASLFAKSAAVAMFPWPRSSRPHPDITRQGLRLHLLMCQDVSYQSGKVFLAVLDCQIGNIPGVFAGIRLRRISNNRFVRIDTSRLFQIARYSPAGEVLMEGFDPVEDQEELWDHEMKYPYQDWRIKEVYIAQSLLLTLPRGFWILPLGQAISIRDVYPPQIWDVATNILQPLEKTLGFAKTGAIQLLVKDERIVLILGASVAYGDIERPWCKLCKYEGENSLASMFSKFELESQLGTKKRLGATHILEDVGSERVGVEVSVTKKLVSSTEMYFVQIGLTP